jgi:hypothetical protein
MSKELVLIPKRKYEDLLQQKGAGESVQNTESERLTNISTPSDDKDGSDSSTMDKNTQDKMGENKGQKMDNPTTYITMKPTNFEKQTYIGKNKKWMKFKL